jgi:2'-5' RNA ligase
VTRTFIAIELTDKLRAELVRQLDRLRHAAPEVRWVEPANLHLTLAFLGELDDERLAAATDAAEAAAAQGQPFRLATAGLGYFGAPHAPRVIWAGIGGESARLAQLHAALAEALDQRGFPREERPFAPHVTLARVKQPLPAPTVGRLLALVGDGASPAHHAHHHHGSAMWVRHISVMKSELARPAAQYSCLHMSRLGNGAPAGSPPQ